MRLFPESDLLTYTDIEDVDADSEGV